MEYYRIKKVAIIYNDDMDLMYGQGHSSLPSDGVISTAMAVEEALKSDGLSALIIPLRYDVGGLIKILKEFNADIVFNLCEGAMGKSTFEMNVAAMLELFGFRFTGSGPLTLGLALNKGRTKEVLCANGIPTAPYLVLKEVPSRLARDLRFPLIVKPVQEDASIGIDENAVVKDMAGLRKRVDYVFTNHKQSAIVEEYINGREFNVAVMGNHRPRALPVSEIDFSRLSAGNPRICTYEAKWITDSPVYLKTPPVCPADIDKGLEQELCNIAVNAYNVLGCRDYARVDIRMGEDGIPKVLEVNPNPDISPDAGFARSAIAGGLTYSQLIAEIVKVAYGRYMDAR